MQIGVVFPQSEITDDPAAVREYVQAAEATGYTHLAVYDHVVGADISQRPDWRGAYTIDTLFHEPLVLFGYLAGLTTRLQLVTGVIVAPQRQTVLLAKQAAEVDVLSRGRLRLGLGIGWNEVEYEALNENFHNRGKRLNEQIDVLRSLFTEKSVTFHGQWHHINGAGIKPMPIHQPIPIWLGGHAEAALRRAGEKADGWTSTVPAGDEVRSQIKRIREHAAAAGRDPASIGIEGRLTIGTGTPDDWHRTAEEWRGLGATHLSVNTMNSGLQSPQDHIASIRTVWQALSP